MTKEKVEKKGMGCLTRFLIIVILLILAVYAGVRIFFPAERLKAEIIKRAGETLGRHVELDDVSLSIFPGLTLDLKGLRIYNPEDFPGAEFVSIDRLSCGLKLIPLLRKQLIFDEIIVRHPVLRLRKTADGRTNFSFEVETGEEGIQTPLGIKEKVTSEEAALSAFAFDWAEIKNGDLIYIDDSSEIKVTLNNFSLETKLHSDADGQHGRSIGTVKIPSIASSMIPENLPLDIEVAYNAEVDFKYADLVLKNTSLKLNGIPFEVEATVRNFLDLQSIFARVKAVEVSLEPLLLYIPPSESFDRDKLRLSGKLSGELEARMEFDSARKPYFSGSFRINDMSVGYLNVSNRIYFESLSLKFDTDSVSFASGGGQLAEERFQLSGMIRNWDDPVFRISTKGAYAMVGLLPFLDSAYDHEISGRARFDIQISGQQSKWIDAQIRGAASIDNLFYNNDSLTSPLERLDMMVSFKRKGVTIDSLYAEYPGVRLIMTGSLKNGFAHFVQPQKGHKKPYLDYNLYAPVVNYDILIPEEEEESAAAGMAAEGASGEAAAPIFLPDIEAGGSVRADTFKFRGVEFTELTAEVSYSDGIITYKNASGRLYTGNVASEGTVDINDMYQPAIGCSFAGSDIEANDFMARFADIDGHLFGKMNLNGSLTGRGSELDDFVRSLNADGNLSMKEGRLVNFDLITNMANQFGFKTFEEEKIGDLSMAVKIREGKLILDGTRLFSGMGDWNIDGTVAFIDKNLDLRVGLYLSEQYSKNFNLFGGLLQDDKGRVRLNFNISGPYDRPTISNISTDNEVVKEKAKDALKKEAEKLIKDIFKKK
jgi:hypothetical protein